MLKEYFKKVFNPALAETQEEDVTMTITTEQAPALADTTAELSAQLETVTATLADMTTKYAELSTTYEAAKAALEASAEAQAALVAQAKAATMTARTTALAAVMGDVKAPAMAASLESLDDATFATVLSGYAKSFENEANSAMFQEEGASNTQPVEVKTPVDKLAEQFAAEFKTK